MKTVLKIEEAREILERLDPAMPDGFEIKAVAWVPSLNQFVVKWSDPAEKKKYDDGVADPDSGEARKAYERKPSYFRFSAIWFNESPDGKDEPVCEKLSKDDVKALSKEKGVELIDAV